jgi:hypothetical protein
MALARDGSKPLLDHIFGEITIQEMRSESGRIHSFGFRQAEELRAFSTEMTIASLGCLGEMSVRRLGWESRAPAALS